MAVSVREKRAAWSAGRMAARTGRPLSASCPWRPSQGGRQAVLALWFVRGFRSRQRAGSAVSHL